MDRHRSSSTLEVRWAPLRQGPATSEKGTCWKLNGGTCGCTCDGATHATQHFFFSVVKEKGKWKREERVATLASPASQRRMLLGTPDWHGLIFSGITSQVMWSCASAS